MGIKTLFSFNRQTTCQSCGAEIGIVYVLAEDRKEAEERFKKGDYVCGECMADTMWKGECEYYCPYFKAGVCEGKEIAFEDGYIPEEARRLLKEYRALQSELKNLEFTLKKLIRGSFKSGERRLGWVEREVVEIDVEKLLQKLGDKAKDYLQVKWQKKGELIQEHGEEIVKERKTERVWRL